MSRDTPSTSGAGKTRKATGGPTVKNRSAHGYRRGNRKNWHTRKTWDEQTETWR